LVHLKTTPHSLLLRADQVIQRADGARHAPLGVDSPNQTSQRIARVGGRIREP
jgi:hypothetical protein